MSSKLKYIIFQFTPHLVFNWISYLLASTDKLLLNKIKSNKNVYIFLGCDYDNLGDYAITLAQKEMLESIYPEREVSIITIDKTYSGLKAILRNNNRDDLVTIIGGGNMTDLYYGYERKRNFIVRMLSQYRIISYPQSFLYTQTKLGRLALERSIKEYGKHRNLTITARDEEAYKLMKTSFSNTTALCPDVVMTLDRRGKNTRDGAVLSLRKDKERLINETDLCSIKKCLDSLSIEYKSIDTVEVNNEGLLSSFNGLLDTYRKSKFVITDRLHGMIFAYITGTPVIVIPNNNGKIERCHKWIEDCSYIKLLEKEQLSKLDTLINEMNSMSCDDQYFNNKRINLKQYFENL